MAPGDTLLEALAGPVAAAVIDGDHLLVGVIELEQGAHGPSHMLSLVARRDHDRHPGPKRPGSDLGLRALS